MSVQGWFRQLNGDRLELFLKVEGVSGTPDCKVRASGPAEQVGELVDWFEDITGMHVNGLQTWRRPSTGPKPMKGQMALTLGEIEV